MTRLAGAQAEFNQTIDLEGWMGEAFEAQERNFETQNKGIDPLGVKLNLIKQHLTKSS